MRTHGGFFLRKRIEQPELRQPARVAAEELPEDVQVRPAEAVPLPQLTLLRSQIRKKLSAVVNAGHLDFALQPALHYRVVDVFPAQRRHRSAAAAIQLPESGQAAVATAPQLVVDDLAPDLIFLLSDVVGILPSQLELQFGVDSPGVLSVESALDMLLFADHVFGSCLCQPVVDDFGIAIESQFGFPAFTFEV